MPNIFFSAHTPACEIGLCSINAHLSGGIGNLVERVTATKLCPTGTVEPISDAAPDAPWLQQHEDALLHKFAPSSLRSVASAYSNADVRTATAGIQGLISQLNAYMSHAKPWDKDHTEHDRQRVLALTTEGLRVCAQLLLPVIPLGATRVLCRLGFCPDMHARTGALQRLAADALVHCSGDASVKHTDAGLPDSSSSNAASVTEVPEGPYFGSTLRQTRHFKPHDGIPVEEASMSVPSRAKLPRRGQVPIFPMLA